VSLVSLTRFAPAWRRTVHSAQTAFLFSDIPHPYLSFPQELPELPEPEENDLIKGMKIDISNPYKVQSGRWRTCPLPSLMKR
jgi:hypothetical protein